MTRGDTPGDDPTARTDGATANGDGTLPGHRAGAGPPLLLVHGWGGCWQHWSPMLPELARHHDVSAVDVPGFGTAAPVEPSVDALADALEGHLDALGWQRSHLVGNSLGGLLALELARRGRALTVTAFASAGMAVGWEEAWARGVLRSMLEAVRRAGPVVDRLLRRPAGRAAAFAPLLARPWAVDRELAVTMAAALRDATSARPLLDIMQRETTTARLDEIDVPVTFAWGDRDRVLWPRQGTRFRRAMPDARLVHLDGLGHLAMVDDPEVCTQLVLTATGV